MPTQPGTESSMGLGAGEEGHVPRQTHISFIMPCLAPCLPDGGWRMVLQLGWMESGKSETSPHHPRCGGVGQPLDSLPCALTSGCVRVVPEQRNKTQTPPAQQRNRSFVCFFSLLAPVFPLSLAAVLSIVTLSVTKPGLVFALDHPCLSVNGRTRRLR